MSTNNFITSATASASNTAKSTPFRRVSITAGLLYILTFVSIPTFVLYGPAHEPNFIISNGSDNAIISGGLLEIVVALAGIATAIVLYPVLKKQNESMALGLVAARVLEAATIFVGVAFLLSLVTLHQSGAGKDALATSHALVALYDRIFLLGQSFIPAICDLLLGVLLYKSRLVPRALSLIGIAGALPLIVGYTATMYGYIDRMSLWAGLSAVLVAVFEFSLGVYLILKGFKQNS
jgi:cytochrome bd-type quinol oxidase subunit 2